MVATHYSYWKGTVRLQPSDLGISEQDIDPKLFSLGHKKIMGRNVERINEFKVLANKFSKIIVNNSFNFLDKLRYVPNERLSKVREQLDAVIAESELKAQEFMRDYPRLIEEATSEWLTFAHSATMKNGDMVFEPSQIPHFMAKIAESFPSIPRLSRTFKFSYNVVNVVVPDAQVATEIASIRDQEDIASARSKLIADEARKLADESQAFLNQCLQEMRNGLVNVVNEVNASLQNSKNKPNQKTINKLANYFAQVRAMNFANDRGITDLINQFEGKFLGCSAVEYQDNQAALEALRGGVKTLASQAKELAAQDVSNIAADFGKVASRKIRFS